MAKPSLDSFLWSLFPTGANVPDGYLANPSDVMPDEVQTILEKISDDTDN